MGPCCVSTSSPPMTRPPRSGFRRCAGDYLDALLASVPGFATRFYMSLAATLVRLRAPAERLS